MELTQGRAFILVVGALCVAVLVVGLVALYLLRRRDPYPWAPLPGYYPGSRWHSTVPMDVRRLVAALQAAEQCLIERTNWTAANMALVGHYVRLRIAGSESWSKLWEGARPVHDHIVIGPALTGLCHELAHLAEVVIDSRNTSDHEAWHELGVERALEDYDQWTARQQAADRLASGNVVPISRGNPLTGMQACRYRRPG